MNKTSVQEGGGGRSSLKISYTKAGILEAILVIFGRRAFFLFESSWKIIKNDTNFVRICSGDHLWDAKR